MATVRLDERRVQTLKPRKHAYDVRDRELKGFGVRVLPSGAKRYFIHSQHHGRRVMSLVMAAAAFLAKLSADMRRMACRKRNKSSPHTATAGLPP